MAKDKLLTHPAREEIIKQLIDGISPNKVADWLVAKYPQDKQYHIPFGTLSLFRKNFLNMNRDVARALKKEKQLKALGLEGNEKLVSFLEKSAELKIAIPKEKKKALKVKQVLLQSATYQEKLKNITEATLDGPKLIKELVSLLQARLEVYFNEIASSSSAGETLKTDKMFAEYVALMKDLIKDSKKIDDDYNSQPDEGTVQLNVVHEQVGLIRETVKELLAEFSPDLALEFMDKLNKRMSVLKYEPRHTPDILQRVDKLNKQIKEIQDASRE